MLEGGWSVTVLVRDAQRLGPFLNQRAEIIVGDLANAEALERAVSGCDVVFHCAANVKTWDQWSNYEAANITPIPLLMKAMEGCGPNKPRLVHLSTVDVYGFPTVACDEADVTNGAGFSYGTSKLIGEALVWQGAKQYGIATTVLRPCNVIGPGSQFIARIGAELRSGLMLTIDGGRINGGFLYIDTLIDYMVWAASDDRAIGQCYNVRDGYDANWGTFVRLFKTGIGGRGVVISLPFALADGVARVVEGVWKAMGLSGEPLLHRLIIRLFGRTCGHRADKIRRDSGIGSRLTFQEAMDRSVEWFLNVKK